MRHCDKHLSIFSLINFIDSADILMIKCRGSLRFGCKTPGSLVIASQMMRKELESYKTFEPNIFRLIHNPHSAFAQFSEDMIVGDCFTDNIFHKQKSRGYMPI